jgi:hypothetical protein
LLSSRATKEGVRWQHWRIESEVPFGATNRKAAFPPWVAFFLMPEVHELAIYDPKRPVYQPRPPTSIRQRTTNDTVVDAYDAAANVERGKGGPKDKEPKSSTSKPKGGKTDSQRRRLILDGGSGDEFWANVVTLVQFNEATAATTFANSGTGTDFVGVNSGAVSDTYARSGWGNHLGSGLPQDGAKQVGTGSAFGNGAFCLECWFRPSESVSTSLLFDQRTTVDGAFGTWYVTNSGQDLVYWTGGGIKMTYASSLTDSVWSHLAVWRVSGTTRMAVDGVIGASFADATNYTVDANTWFGTSGRYPLAGSQGALDDLRITVGASRYGTSNFTPPTQGFPAFGA